jgi:Family of unknown function (DUF5694)
MTKRTTCFLFSLVVVALVPATGPAITTTDQQQSKAQVMVLGVYHFNNPNADVVKSNFSDHLSEKKQREIAELLELLARFKPTKIVVEAPPEQVAVQNNYLAYLKGEYQLTANESEQIGFRLAKRFRHAQVYLADHRLGFDFDSIFKAVIRLAVSSKREPPRDKPVASKESLPDFLSSSQRDSPHGQAGGIPSVFTPHCSGWV